MTGDVVPEFEEDELVEVQIIHPEERAMMEIEYNYVSGYVQLSRSEADALLLAESDPVERNSATYSVYEYLEDACYDADSIYFDEQEGKVLFKVQHYLHEQSAMDLKVALGHVADGTWKKRFEDAYFLDN